MKSRYECSFPAGCPFTTNHALNAFAKSRHDRRRLRGVDNARVNRSATLRTATARETMVPCDSSLVSLTDFFTPSTHATQH